MDDDFVDAEYEEGEQPPRFDPPKTETKIVPYTKWDIRTDAALAVAAYFGIASFHNHYPWLSWFHPGVVAQIACCLALVTAAIRYLLKSSDTAMMVHKPMAEEKFVANSNSMLPSTRWKLRLDKPAFDRLKTEESFWCIVALSRVINALRFVHSPLEHYQNDSPGALRVRYNSFFFNCALFREASIFVQKLHKHYGNSPEFQAVATIMNSNETRKILEDNLAPLRNKFVFHFNIEEMGAQLTKLELSEPVFVSAMGTTNEQVYYELADLCAVSTFSGSGFPSTDVDMQAFEQQVLMPLMKKTTELTLQFLTQAELFIVAVLKNGGWEMVTTPE